MTLTTVTRSVKPGIVSGYRFFSFYDDSELSKEHMVDLKSWGLRYHERPEDERAVVVSDEFDQTILDKLLSKYEIVTVASLAGYLNYIGTLNSNVPTIIQTLRRSSHNNIEVSAYEYVESLGKASSLGPVGVDFNVKHLNGSPVVYLLGAPEVMMSLWDKYTDKARLSLYAKVEDGTQCIELPESITQLCTRHEVLQSAGCLACPHRSNCVEHLLQAELSPIDLEVDSLKRQVTRLGIPLLPHSDCKDPNRYGSGRIDVRYINLEGALDRHRNSRKRREAIKLNQKFYNDNCSSCVLKPLCGTAKSYNQVGDSASSYCTGKLPEGTALEVTVHNYIKHLGVMFSSLLSTANKDLDMIPTALELVTDWVETSCNSVPNHASYFISKFNKARKKNMAHQEYYVVPEQLIKLAELFSLRGSFDGYGNNNWYRHGIGDWFDNSTSSITSLLPTVSQSSRWFALAPANTYIKQSDYWSRTRHEYVDTRVLYSVLGANSSYRSKVFSTKEARLQLALEFIAQFLSPGSTYWYGPFGSSKAWVPSGVPSRWSWSWRNKQYQAQETAFPVRTPTQNLVNVLGMLREVDTNLDLLGNNNKLREVILNG